MPPAANLLRDLIGTRRHRLALAVALLACAAPLAAETTYSYVGQPYTFAQPPYVIGERLTGSFSVATRIPAFQPLSNIGFLLLDYSFFDGVQTRTPANTTICAFSVATDGAGRIVDWRISLREAPTPPLGNPQQSIDSAPLVEFVGSGPAGATACAVFSVNPRAESDVPGTWSADLPAGTPTTYDYLGNRYTTADPPYTTSERLSGSILLGNPLPPFLPMTEISAALDDFAFSDGVQTRTKTNTLICSFKVSTDAVGNIVQWAITLRSPYTGIGNPEASIDSVPASDLVGTGSAGNSGCATMSLSPFASAPGPGTWSANLPPGKPITYGYLGQPFTFADPPYTTSDRIAGSIRLGNRLPPFLPMTDITQALVDFSFGDGVQTRTPSNSTVCFFQVATDGVGNIVRWALDLRQSPTPAPGNPEQLLDSSNGIDLAGTGPTAATACGIVSLTTFGSTNNPGTWSANLPPGRATTYDYTGPAYIIALAPYTLQQNLTGTMRFGNPLPPNLPLTDVSAALEDLTFADGQQTRRLADTQPCRIEVGTDGASEIVEWEINLIQTGVATGNPEGSINSIRLGVSAVDLVGFFPANPNPCNVQILNPFAQTFPNGHWTRVRSTEEIPTLSHTGMAALAVLLAAAALGSRRWSRAEKR